MSSNVGFMVVGGSGMLSNVIKMLINVGNWIRKCDQMLAQNVLECETKVRLMSSNVGFMVVGGFVMLSNVVKMLTNVGNWM